MSTPEGRRRALTVVIEATEVELAEIDSRRAELERKEAELCIEAGNTLTENGSLFAAAVRPLPCSLQGWTRFVMTRSRDEVIAIPRSMKPDLGRRFGMRGLAPFRRTDPTRAPRPWPMDAIQTEAPQVVPGS